MKNDDKLTLNQEQKKAVEYNKGPLLIVAGAGTGKTLVIAEKMRYLIEKKRAKPEEILALTFTEKAAREMEERVDKTLPYGYFQMWISTFHSFADQVLREEIAAIGLNPSYKLMNQAETIIFLRDNLFLFNLKYFRPLGNPNKFLESLLQHFSRLKDEDISPEEYLKWAGHTKEDKEKNLELAQAYEMYQKLKIKEGCFDFSDLIYYLLELFRKRKTILKKYQAQFKYVLVDEFQDTNIAQYDLIKLLCPLKNNPQLTVVGDDSQAIYKFRGASVSNILAFMKDYKNAVQITLRQNYRSYQGILDAAYKLIKHNDPDTLEFQLGISKDLTAHRVGSGKVDYFLSDRVEEEADWVAAKILKLNKDYQPRSTPIESGSNRGKYSDFAILVRANNHADPFIRALAQRGIPYQFLGPGVLFKQPEVKDLIAYLNLLADLEDSVSLYRVLSMDVFDIDRKDIALLLSFSKKVARPLFQTLEIYLGEIDPDLIGVENENYKPYLPILGNKTKDQLISVYKMIKRHLKLIRKETAGQILYYFLLDTEYLNRLTTYKTVKDEKVALNISKFFSRLKNYEMQHEDASVPTAVDFIKMSMELGESPLALDDNSIEYDAVNILTVHSAKGLEWPVVFLVNLVAGRFPTYERREKIPIPPELIKEVLPQGNYHLLEERRLFYVALTRTMDKAYLTTAKFYAEGRRERKISPFIEEALGKSFINQKHDGKKEASQFSIFDFKKTATETVKKESLPTTFSFSQLETYLLCPLRYKYQYALRIPTTPNASASFGSTIHNALESFYQQFLKDKTIGLKELLAFYKSSWIPIGYSSPAHEARLKKEGEQMLTNYFKTFHDKKNQIIDLEKSFKIKIDRDITITGKIDRVDGRSNNEIEIIDYKTGKKPDEKRLKGSLQLSIYLLAAHNKGLYDKPIDKINLTFYYLQDMERISMKKTEADVEDVKTKVRATVTEIRAGEFSPNVGPHCDFCPYRMICEAWQ